MCNYPSLFVSLSHSITVGFIELIFSSLIQIAALNLKSRHYVTLAMPRVVPVRRAKVFMHTQRKVVRYFTCQGESTCPPELSCPQVWFAILE